MKSNVPAPILEATMDLIRYIDETGIMTEEEIRMEAEYQCTYCDLNVLYRDVEQKMKSEKLGAFFNKYFGPCYSAKDVAKYVRESKQIYLELTPFAYKLNEDQQVSFLTELDSMEEFSVGYDHKFPDYPV